MLSRKPSGTHGRTAFMFQRHKQDGGWTLAFLGTGYTGALLDLRGICPLFLTKNHGFFRNRGQNCPFLTATHSLSPVGHSKWAPNNTEMATAISTRYSPVVCKIFSGFPRFPFSIYIWHLLMPKCRPLNPFQMTKQMLCFAKVLSPWSAPEDLASARHCPMWWCVRWLHLSAPRSFRELLCN